VKDVGLSGSPGIQIMLGYALNVKVPDITNPKRERLIKI